MGEQDKESILTLSENDDEIDERCYYSIKLINPERKAEYSVKKWCTRTVFKIVSHLITKLREGYAELENPVKSYELVIWIQVMDGKENNIG